MYKIYKKIAILSVMVCAALSFISFGAVYDDEYGTRKESDFENVTFSCSVGTIEDEIVKSVYPDAKIVYYNTVSDTVTSLMTGKSEASIAADSVFNELHRVDNNVKKLSKTIYSFHQGFLLSDNICKNEDGIIQKQLNEFIRESIENGFIKNLKNKWCYGNTKDIRYEHKIVKNPKKVLHIGMFDDTPYVYYKNGLCEGLDIELIETFCEKYNYSIETELTDLSSVLLGIATSKYDIGIGGITITDERKKSMTFSESYFIDEVHVLYYERANKTVGFFEYLKNEFYESFIQENRYEFLLKGLLNTILITIFSVVVGMILGFVLYVIYRKNVIVVNKFIRLYAYLINGTPFLVFLLILYYIVFSKVSISGITISIIAFVIVFSLFIFESLDNNIKLIDKGQIEAAYALGYTDNETFMKILLPQAIVNTYSSFQDEVISLLKNTSIVGYIAVEDITKVGDVIRSRTYKAIFPVISIAIIYFILGSIFKLILNTIGRYINPRKKRKSGNKKKWGGIKMIKVEHLKKTYDNIEPIKDINCIINKGDIISIIGPSGTGKSTFLRMINMLERPTSGHIYIDDIDVTEKNAPLNKIRQKVGMVFQSFNLFPHKTIIENIMMAPMDLKKIEKKVAYNKAIELLRVVGLADKALSYPDELSGGQKQRVAIARTLAMEPEVILFDEPTSALDPTMVLEVEKVIRQLAKENYTMLIVTHEMKFAKSISKRVFYLDEGTIYEEGTPEQIFDNPQKKKTQDFIRKQKTYSVSITDKDFDFLGEEVNIDNFCRSQNMPYHMINNIQLAFEEICVVNILKNKDINNDIKVMIGIEHFIENNETLMAIKYSGKELDVSSIGDDISKNIIKNIASEIEYEAINDGEYKNKILMKFI